MSDVTPDQPGDAAVEVVPCKVFDPWMSVLEDAGIPPRAFFESLDLDYDRVRDFDHRITWSKWIESVEELEHRLGGEGSFEHSFRLGQTVLMLESTRLLQKFAGLFTDPRFMYRVIWRWFGPSMFPGIGSTLTQVENRRVVGEMTIPEGWEMSPAFFRLNRAVMLDVPRLVGAGPARIDLEIRGRTGIFEIHLPPSGDLWTRLKRTVKSTFFKDEMLRELEGQHSALASSYRRLEEKQEELLDNVRNFRALTERSTEAISVIRDGALVYANPAMARFLKYDSVDDLLDLPVDDLFVDETPEQVVGSPEHASTNPFDPREDVLFRTRDGGSVRGDVNRVEMVYEGHPSLMLISRDVTERRELAARMMQMDRMIAVGTLAAGVAHEINNPLTYVVTNTDFSLSLVSQVREDIDALAAAESDKVDEIRAKLDLIEDSLADAQHGGKRVTSIVRDLRTFSRSKNRSNKAIDVNEVVANAIKMGWHELRDTVELVQTLDATRLAEVEPSRLSQVVLNILINAAHAIEASRRDDTRVSVRTWDDEDRVHIEIRDTGTGINADDLEQIFDPFFTTKPVGKGTGLGLSICKNLVDEMGGRLSVSSQVGEGTTVELTLPVPEEPVSLDSDASVPVDVGAFSGLSILVIDDDPMLGQSIARLLRINCEIMAVQSGSVALEYLDTQQPDLVLCDVLMNGMSGLEFFDVLRDEYPALSENLVFMTAGAFTDVDTERLEQSGRPIVSKPFTLTDLHDAYSDLL